MWRLCSLTLLERGGSQIGDNGGDERGCAASCQVRRGAALETIGGSRRRPMSWSGNWQGACGAKDAAALPLYRLDGPPKAPLRVEPLAPGPSVRDPCELLAVLPRQFFSAAAETQRQNVALAKMRRAKVGTCCTRIANGDEASLTVLILLVISSACMTLVSCIGCNLFESDYRDGYVSRKESVY